MRHGNDYNFCRLIGREIDELNVAYNTKAGDSYCSLSPAYPIVAYIGKHWLCPKSGLKDGGVPKSPCLTIGSHGAHRYARFQISTLIRTAGAPGTPLQSIKARQRLSNCEGTSNGKHL
jgi:hypothetical protein